MAFNPYSPPTTEAKPYTSSQELQLASRMDRFAGAFIDGFISLVINIPLGIVLGIVLALIGLDPEESIAGNVVLWLASVVIGLGSFLLVNGYLLASRGQTVGKMVVGTQIVSDEGQLVPIVPLILKRYAWIWILSIVPLVGGLIGLVNVLLIFRSNKKSLHDDVAGTKLINL